MRTVAYMTNPVDGAAIRQLRVAKALNLREVAEQAQIDPGYLSRIERGISGTKGKQPNVSPKVTGRIADALGVPIAALTDPKVFAAEHEKARLRPRSVCRQRKAVA